GYTAKQLSRELQLSEKDVLFQLEELRKSLKKSKAKLVCEPPTCFICDYVFENRKHLKKPGRCPKCKGQRISEPFYSIHES
ncbi:MAG: transcriptional regulator, partial [Myxococcota bacterium]